ncbi:hypothetical protein RINTU1_27810 [Candidatus Regiella insecticola]|uniref:Uncharacterized protein n=1 Tax=Candidatus Regiella insecticola TaxID=138073 RepID=A0A6L2ZRE1_9ENTR|nr:hypothetical protein RINTU1_27810 [Candidatus Regiella insecticola]
MKKFTVCLKALPILLLSTSALAWFGDIRSYDKFKCKYQMNSFGHKVEVCELIRTPPVSASAPVSKMTVAAVAITITVATIAVVMVTVVTVMATVAIVVTNFSTFNSVFAKLSTHR